MPSIVIQCAKVLLLLVAFCATVACGAASVASEEPAAPSVAIPSAAPAIETTAPAASAAAGDSVYASLPQSTTSAGYYVLGDPTAPVLMQYYSDFL